MQAPECRRAPLPVSRTPGQSRWFELRSAALFGDCRSMVLVRPWSLAAEALREKTTRAALRAAE